MDHLAMGHVGMLRRLTLHGLRWALLGGVIAGVLAMHVLGGHGSTGGMTSMPMQPVSASAVMPSAGMSMDLAATMDAVVPDSVGPAAVVPDTLTADTLTADTLTNDVEMTDMSCCVLSLVTTGLLVVAALWSCALFLASARSGGTTMAGSRRIRRRAGAGPPRISLCVVRV